MEVSLKKVITKQLDIDRGCLKSTRRSEPRGLVKTKFRVPEAKKNSTGGRAGTPGVAGGVLGLPAKPIIFLKGGSFISREKKSWVFFSSFRGVFVLLGGVFVLLGRFLLFARQRDFLGGVFFEGIPHRNQCW